MRLTFLKDNITRDENTTSRNVLDLIISTTGRVSKQPTLSAPGIQFRVTMRVRYLGPAFSAKNAKVSNILSPSKETLSRNMIRMSTGGNKITRINRVGSRFSPVGVAKAGIT